MRHFVAVGGSSLWFRASLSRGGGFLSNARDRAEAGRNKHTPLASEVISFSHELCFCFFSPAVESVLCLGRLKNGPIFFLHEAARETEQKVPHGNDVPET